MDAPLEPTLDPDIRLGSVPYLNAMPLTWGLEKQTIFLPPNELSQALEAGEVDVALLSITEALFSDRYQIVDGLGVCSHDAVNSVFLAHQHRLDAVTEIHCDSASLTSVNLLRVLCRHHGMDPRLRPLTNYERAAQHPNVLLIGNPAIRFRQQDHTHQIWDLGAAWRKQTGLPFVYAVWVVRAELESDALVPVLHHALAQGLENMDTIVARYPEFTPEFRRTYLTHHIHYRIGPDELRGIHRFAAELRETQNQRVYDPVFYQSAPAAGRP